MIRSLILILVFAAAASAQNPSDLYQQALLRERSHGDLKGAIALYHRVAQGSDRALAARALLRMGEAYEKLGQKEALNAYRRIVSQFADQRDVVTNARARIIVLEKTRPANGPKPLTLRLIASDLDGQGAPTPDGEWLTFVDWNHARGDLTLRSTQTSEVRKVTKTAHDGLSFAMESVIAPNGRTIAYVWSYPDKKKWRPQLRFVDLDGTNDRVVIENQDYKTDHIYPYGFTADSRTLLVGITTVTDTARLALVDVATGTVRPAVYLGEKLPNRAAISPDGRWIAYDVRQDTLSFLRDVVIASRDGRISARLEHPASDSDPLWMPDNKHIVFSSNRSGSPALWVLRIQDGVPAGEPRWIQGGMTWGFKPKGFAGSTLFYTQEGGNDDIHMANFDAVTGKATGVTHLLDSYLGGNIAAAWSADGSMIAFASRRGPVPQGQFGLLVVKNMRNGSERVFERIPMSGTFSRPVPSPRGTYVLAELHDETKQQLAVIHTNTGAVQPILQRQMHEGDGVIRFSHGTWKSDSVFVAITTIRKDSVARRSFYEYNVMTGEAKEIYTPKFPAALMALGSDGSITYGQEFGDTLKIRHWSPADGHDRELVSSVRANATALRWLTRIAISPDAKHVVYGEVSGNPVERMVELMSVPVDGGSPRSTGIIMRDITYVSFAPDGRLTFTAGRRYRTEVWALDNLTIK